MNEELQLLQDNVRRFIETEIAPHYEQWERDEIVPRELWKQVGNQGLLAVDIPEEYGGFGANFLHSMTIQEEFSRSNCPSVGGMMAVHSDIVAHYILNNGTEQQKLHYLPKMVSGDCVGAIAMTEPGAGSDLQGIRAHAKRDGDHFVLNGSKTFITNGQHADLVIVVAKTNLDVAGSKGTSLFLVDAQTPGFTKGRNLEKIGMHPSDTSELFFTDVRVHESKILGQLDRGFIVLMGELQRERLALAVRCVAAAEGILAKTIEYVKDRQVFGQSLADFQNTKFKLAEAATEVRINRSFINECKDLLVKNELDVATASMAKLSASEMQGRVVDTCLQLHGGYGYMKEYGVSRAYVDARVQRIYGGSSEIMKELISRSILK